MLLNILPDIQLVQLDTGGRAGKMAGRKDAFAENGKDCARNLIGFAAHQNAARGPSGARR